MPIKTDQIKWADELEPAAGNSSIKVDQIEWDYGTGGSEGSTTGAFASAIRDLPANILKTSIGALQGQSGASIADQGFLDKIYNAIEDDNAAIAEDYKMSGGKFIPGISDADVYSAITSLPYTGFAAAAALGGAAAAAPIPVPGARIAGGMAASYAMTNRISGYAAMNRNLKKYNQMVVEQTGNPITIEQENEFKESYSKDIGSIANWESIPESFGTMVEFAIYNVGGKYLPAPAKQKVASIIGSLIKNKLAKGVAKNATKAFGTLITETAEEVVSAIGGGNIEKRMWNEEESEWDIPTAIQTAKEVLPQVAITAGAVHGAGSLAGRLGQRKENELTPEDGFDADMDAADLLAAIDQGIATNELTPEDASDMVQQAYADKILSAEDLSNFEGKYPGIRKESSEIVPEETAIPDTDTTINEKRFEEDPLDPTNNAEYLRKLTLQKTLPEGKALTPREINEEIATRFYEPPPERTAEESAKIFEEETKRLESLEERKIQTRAELEPDINKFLLRKKDTGLKLTPFESRKIDKATKEYQELTLQGIDWSGNWLEPLLEKRKRLAELDAAIKDKFGENEGLLQPEPAPSKTKELPAGQTFELIEQPGLLGVTARDKWLSLQEWVLENNPELIDTLSKVSQGIEIPLAEEVSLLQGIPELPFKAILSEDERLGGQPTKQYIEERRKRRRKQRIEYEKKEKQAAKLKQKPSKARTLRGAIREMGGINFLNFTGELKDLNQFDQKAISRKDGVGIDQAVDDLIADNWLPKDTTVESFLEELRTNPRDFLSRDRTIVDVMAKKEHELSGHDKKLKKAIEFEAEAPPEGEYVTMNAEDLPVGKELTLLEGKTARGWDLYEVIENQDPFEVILQDGKKVTLSPLDKVQVLKADLPRAKAAKPKVSPEAGQVSPRLLERQKTIFEVVIPTFRDTAQAEEFGKKATPEQITELKRLRKESEDRYAELTGQEQFDEAFRAQLYREALEAKLPKTVPDKAVGFVPAKAKEGVKEKSYEEGQEKVPGVKEIFKADQENTKSEYVPITRKEADSLSDEGAVELIAHFNVRGAAETTDEEGYYMRRPVQKKLPAYGGGKQLKYDQKFLELYEKYKERHGKAESAVSITAGETKEQARRPKAILRGEKKEVKGKAFFSAVPQDKLRRTTTQDMKSDLKDIFKGMKNIRTGQDSKGNLWFRAKGHARVTIYEVDHIEGYVQTSAGRIPVGSFQEGNVELKTGGAGPVADIETIFHEIGGHFFEESGILSGNDIKALDTAIGKEDATEEDRADYIGKNLADWHNQKNRRIKRVLKKIADFINAVYEFIARVRTARGVLSDIGSGAILDEKKGVLSGINQFAQDVSYSLKDAVANIRDNPNFRKWFRDSKVLGHKQEPLVVYHGTQTGGFAIFDKEKQGIRTTGNGTSFSVKAKEPGKQFQTKPAKGGYKELLEQYRKERESSSADVEQVSPEQTKQTVKETRNNVRKSGFWSRFKSEVVTTKDMKWYNKALETPYVLAKKFKGMEKALRAEIRRHETRSQMMFDLYHGDLDKLQKHMKKNPEDIKRLEALIWEWENKRMPKKAVPTDWFSIQDDIKKGDDYGDLVINPQHYVEVKNYLLKQGHKEVVVDGFITERKLLDQVLIDADQKMRSGNVDKADLQEFREYIGKVNNYFPHEREGDSYIRIYDKKTGKVVYREHYFDKRERLLKHEDKAKSRTKRWLKEQIKSGKLAGEETDYRIGTERNLTKLPDEVYFQIPVEAMDQIAQVSGKVLTASRVTAEAKRLIKQGMSEEKAYKQARSTLTAGMEKAVAKAISDVLKTRGWGAHAIGRQNTPGFKKTETFDTLFKYLSGYTGFITKMDAAKEHHKTLHDIDAKNTPEEYRYTSDYIRDMLANADKVDRVVDGLRAAFFIKYLGGVFKSGLVNLTQNVVMAGPVLSQYTKGSHRKLAKAMADTRKAVTGKNAWTGKETEYKHLAKNEQAAMKVLLETGAAQDLFLRELKGNIPGSGWGKQAQKVLAKAGIFMQVAEKYNRASTGLAAFRIAFDEGATYDGKPTKGNHELSVKFASKAIYDSHFLYGKPNMPAAFRGGDVRKVLRAGYTFRSFAHNYLNIMTDLFLNQGTAGKKAAARSFLNIMAVGGLTAIPFFKVLSEAIMSAIGDDDEDALTVLREQMPNKFMQDLLVYGLPGAVFGVDLTGSLSIETPKNFKDIIGVPYSIGEDFMNMKESIKAGNTYRAISETPFTPIVIRNAMRGIELFTVGQRTRGGKDINVPWEKGARKIELDEAIKKGVFGLQPVDLSSGYKGYRAAGKLKRSISDRKRAWADRLANAIQKKDRKEEIKIKKEINDWNLKARRDKKRYLIVDVDKMVEARLKGSGLRGFPVRMRKEARSRYEAWN